MIKRLFFRGGVILGTIAIIAAGAAAFSAFEAHVVNVTATINNALDVPVESTGMSFGTVFPQESTSSPITISLSSSFNAQAQCSATNLVTNGGFESPVVTNSANWDLFPNGASGLAWNVVWDPIVPATWNGNNRPSPALIEYQKHVVSGWDPQEGQQYTELHSDWTGPPNNLQAPSAIDIYQDLPTTASKQYQITFWYSPRPGVDAAENGMEVFWNGVSIANIAIDGTGNSTTVWTKYTYTVTATGATTRLEFDGRGNPDSSTGTFLDNVSVVAQCAGQTTVDYVIKQKPKCQANDANATVQHPQVTENGNTFVCPTGSTMMLLLCPYLSKHKLVNSCDPNVPVGGPNACPGIDAFHGLPGPWTPSTTDATALNTTGVLSAPGDLTDTWNIDLKAPCFQKQCSQDWPAFVHAENPTADPVAYEVLPGDESKVFGCDLWLEVTGINPVD
jgi:hypothetical protein